MMQRVAMYRFVCLLAVFVALAAMTPQALAAALYSVTDLGDLPGGNNESSAYGVNDNGQVVGYSGATTGQRAFRWSSGSMQDIGDLSGGNDFSFAYGINNNGQVVGWSKADTGDRAFLWSSGSMSDLGDLLGGNNSSFAYGINNNGQVVGCSSATTGQRAFLWSSGSGMQDLNDYLDASGTGWALRWASDINDAGQIVGYGMYGGATRAFLLTPVPEPGSLAMLLGIALTGLLYGWRRRG